MEVGNGLRRCNKRKMSEVEVEVEGSGFALNELNQDVLERVLSRLPTSSFFRLSSVCKRWKSVAESATFRRACSEITCRDPWFFMVDSESNLSQHPIIFDSTESKWKKLNRLCPNQDNSFQDFIPVAASGGLICFHRETDGGFIISNPITATFRQINPPTYHQSQSPIQAISMVSKTGSFKLIIVSGELTDLKFRQYDSTTDQWGDETQLTRKHHHSKQSTTDDDGDCTPYFLSKCGNVVSTNIERNPSKQYSSIITLKNGDEFLHFLSSSGSIVSCNLTRKSYFEYPRLLPVYSEFSIDLVECGGEMYVVLLSEFLESASVRVWRWDDGWRQAAAMPPWMAQKFYGKKVDVNCAGAGEGMMVCVNSGDFCSYVKCDLGANEWVELPECGGDGDGGGAKEFVCAWSFEPRIEVYL